MNLVISLIEIIEERKITTQAICKIWKKFIICPCLLLNLAFRLREDSPIETYTGGIKAFIRNKNKARFCHAYTKILWKRKWLVAWSLHGKMNGLSERGIRWSTTIRTADHFGRICKRESSIL